jgi:hypothetical protein
MIVNPTRWLWIASVMLVLGAVLPFLIVIKVLANTLWLSFFSYAVSVGGLFLGMIALSGVVGERRRDEEDSFGV